MNYLSKVRLILLFNLILFSNFACNKNSGQGSDSSESQQTDSSRSTAQLAQLDSVQVIDYVKKHPEFKEHEKLVRVFYRDRGWKLGWFKNGKLVPQANSLLDFIGRAEEEALNPKDYQFMDYRKMFKDYEDTRNEAERLKKQQEIDVALTASYFNYGSDFYRGIVNPRKTEGISWRVKRNKIKLNKALQTILKERESRYPYYEFAPLHEDYKHLRTALKRYREMQSKGPWPQIPEVKNLKLGDQSPVVNNVRKRLLLEYDPAKASSFSAKTDTVFDESLDQLVRKFQEINGLAVDGVVGGETLKAMNVSIDDRIEQIIINMERWRWIPKRFGDKYILVNIPEYMLRVYENDKEALNMKVVVGKTLNSTPIFSDKLEYVVFSPYWNVPASILENEVKPAMLRNPNFIASQDMEIVSGSGKNLQRISPSSIDWANVNGKTFKYLIRQRPGPKNSLGLVKFMFPNEYNVYLHDTPFDKLFSQTERGFSHGCIRLEQPAKLANYLLKNKPGWNESKIEEAMNAREEQWVNLKEKVPVYIVYFTSWADADGNVHFRKDLYGHDKDLKNEYFN
ncbi:L,D-transpeptidase family protein [Adhaeribacter terreus]|uniref:Murein L,D-transpeptidase n=1 Tax=Adhaeribacter terreus TaxID=529703 RepID=A0ABW0EBL3_9BACT